MLLLDERIRADGTIARSWAARAGDRVRITDDEGIDGVDGELSVAALDRVMCRYGRPLDPAIPLPSGAPDGDGGDGTTSVLDLPGGYRLRRLRYHAPVDATGRDYLVWERAALPGEPLAVIATMATAALRYLVARLAGERPQESEG
ncbi:MAG TPA: hypothetical protein VNO30_12575 [Kofleriaceae bacterium]|nr:hypothetical protein [Kofleriaceae bacterium]